MLSAVRALISTKYMNDKKVVHPQKIGLSNRRRLTSTSRVRKINIIHHGWPTMTLRLASLLRREPSSLRDAVGVVFRCAEVARRRWRAPYWRRSSVSPIGTHRMPAGCQPHPITRGIAPPISRHTHECHVRTSNTTAARPVVRVPSCSVHLVKNFRSRMRSPIKSAGICKDDDPTSIASQKSHEESSGFITADWGCSVK